MGEHSGRELVFERIRIIDENGLTCIQAVSCSLVFEIRTIDRKEMQAVSHSPVFEGIRNTDKMVNMYSGCESLSRL